MSIAALNCLKPSKEADGFFRPHRVDVLALGAPCSIVKVEDGRGIPMVEGKLERLRFEFNARQSK